MSDKISVTLKDSTITTLINGHPVEEWPARQRLERLAHAYQTIRVNAPDGPERDAALKALIMMGIGRILEEQG